MFRVSLAEVGSRALEANLSYHSSVENRPAAVEGIIPGLFWSELDHGSLEGRQLLIDTETVEDHTFRGVLGLVTIEKEADWSARLHWYHIRLVSSFDQHPDLRGLHPGGLCRHRLTRAEEIP
jgi:hypothetical protein